MESAPSVGETSGCVVVVVEEEEVVVVVAETVSFWPAGGSFHRCQQEMKPNFELCRKPGAALPLFDAVEKRTWHR